MTGCSESLWMRSGFWDPVNWSFSVELCQRRSWQRAISSPALQILPPGFLTFPYDPSWWHLVSQTLFLSFLLNSSNSTRARVLHSIWLLCCWVFFSFTVLPLQSCQCFSVSLSPGRELFFLCTVGAKRHPSFLFSITSIEDEQSPQTNGNVQNCYTTELI